jgi:sec-independent protein translocase protein TatB
VFFNLGPLEIGVLVIVALVVFGPDRLPTLARDAARMIRTLRELAQGARTQLRDELGPELGNLDLASLNPRTALRRALLDDDDEDRSPTSPAASTSTSAEAPPIRPAEATRPLARGEEAPYDGDAT